MPSYKTPTSPKVYTTRYEGFKGVDFNCDDEVISKNRFPYAQNLIIDDNGYPDKRPGWETVSVGSNSFDACHMVSGKINGEERLALIGDNTGFTVLKENEKGEIEAIFGRDQFKHLNDASILNVEDGFLIKFRSTINTDGFYFYDDEKFVNLYSDDYAYVPTTVIGRNYQTVYDQNAKTTTEFVSPGDVYESVNLLSRKRTNSFCLTSFVTKGYSLYKGYYNYATVILDSNVDSSKTSWEGGKNWKLELLVNGVWKEVDVDASRTVPDEAQNLRDEVEITLTENTLKIKSGHKPAIFFKDGTHVQYPDIGENVDNLRITFYAEPAEDKLKDCDLITSFGITDGDRIWLSGNSKYKNYIWYSEFNNKFYFPDDNYVVAGTSETGIIGFSNYKNYLVVHKESNSFSPTIYNIYGSIDSDGKALFRIQNGNSGVGAVSKYGFCMNDDEPLILTKNGVFGLTVENISSELCLKDRSYFVNPRLTEEDLTNAHLFQYKNYILCSNGRGNVYVLQKNLKTYLSHSQSYVFECMLWTDFPAKCFAVMNDRLYFIGDGKLRRLKRKEDTPNYYNDTENGTDKPINAYFLTVADDDSSFMTLKTMTKRGCGIMLKPYEMSSVTVSIIKDRDAAKEIKSHRFGWFDFSKIYFETFDFRQGRAGEIVPFNTKVKKYSLLQFMVSNNKLNEGFGVIGIEKRYIYGNYKKS